MLTLLRDVARELGAMVARITEFDLERPTPCAGWDLRRLLAHQLGQQDGFAQAVATGDAPGSAFERETVTIDRLEPEWRRSTAELLSAFENASADRVIRLAGFGQLRVATVLGMQLLDTAVHAWDVGSALGESYRPADAVVSDIVASARRIAGRPEGSPAFAGPLEVAGDDEWVTALRLLGRAAGDGARWGRA